MENNFPTSGLDWGILETLQTLHRKGRLKVKDLGPETLGGYNRLNGKLTLNSSKFGFLRRDFVRQMNQLESDPDSRRKELVQDQYCRAVIELSGVLMHEGQHAHEWQWSKSEDEKAAFTVEQSWYDHLYTLDSPQKNFIRELSKDSRYDSKNARAYKDLDL